MYKIKLSDNNYATLEQFSDTGVQLYSVDFEGGDSFSTLNEAKRVAKCINNGVDGIFKIYGDKVVDSIVEYEVKIVNEFDFE